MRIGILLVVLPTALNDFVNGLLSFASICPIRPAEAKAFSMMETGRAPAIAPTPAILLGFLPVPPSDAAIRRLSINF